MEMPVLDIASVTKTKCLYSCNFHFAPVASLSASLASNFSMAFLTQSSLHLVFVVPELGTLPALSCRRLLLLLGLLKKSIMKVATVNNLAEDALI